MVPFAPTASLSPAQAEVARLLDRLEVEATGGLEAIARLKGKTTAHVWEALMRGVIPNPYRSAMLKVLSAHETANTGSAVRLEHIADGGCSQVYSGWDWETKQPVAIKYLMTGAGTQLNGKREVGMLRTLDASTLQRDPLTPRLVFAGPDEGAGTVDYFASEYCDGVCEYELMKAREGVSPGYAAHSLWEQAHLLHKLHSRGLMHEDMKPGNVLLSVRDNVRYVCDLGLAAYAEDPPRNDGVATGTPTHMSPEQFRGCPDMASDVYGLGVTAYQMITGRLPFSTGKGNVQIMHLKEKGVSDAMKERLYAHAPAAVADCVIAALDVDKCRRPSPELMRDCFLRWHIFLNRAMLPNDKADEIRSPADYLAKLTLEERRRPFGIDTEPGAEDPIRHYRKGPQTVKLSAKKIADAQNRKFKANAANAVHFLPEYDGTADQSTGMMSLAH
jgi:serine/threonine protein kinase